MSQGSPRGSIDLFSHLLTLKVILHLSTSHGPGDLLGCLLEPLPFSEMSLDACILRALQLWQEGPGQAVMLKVAISDPGSGLGARRKLT